MPDCLRIGSVPVHPFYADPTSVLTDCLEGRRPWNPAMGDLAELALHTWQNALHEAFYLWVNGLDLFKPARLLYPLWDRSPPGALARLARLTAALSRKDPGAVRATTAALQAGPYGHPAVDAQVLAAGYRDLERIAAKQPDGEPWQAVSTGIPFSPAAYQSPFASPVLVMAREGAETLDPAVGLHVHGSMATRDWIEGSSDLDTLVILPQVVAADSLRLRTVRGQLIRLLRHAYAIDPLQHHGHFVITEADLAWYPPAFFPLDLLAYTTTLTGPRRVCWRSRTWSAERKTQFVRPLRYLLDLANRGVWFRSLYTWKGFLQTILLLPTNYLSARGRQVYKRDSFDLCRAELGETFAVVDQSTAVRAAGFLKPPGAAWRRWAGVCPNPWHLGAAARLLPIRPSLYRLLSPDWLQNAATLATTMATRLEREGWL